MNSKEYVIEVNRIAMTIVLLPAQQTQREVATVTRHKCTKAPCQTQKDSSIECHFVLVLMPFTCAETDGAEAADGNQARARDEYLYCSCTEGSK